MHAKAKRIIGLFVILGTLVLASSFIVMDEPPPDVSDLVPPQRLEIPDAKNSYVALMNAASLIRNGDQLNDVSREGGEAFELGEEFSPELRERLRTVAVANSKALAALDAALVIQQYQSPSLESKKLSFQISTFLKLTKLIEIDFWSDFLRGHPADASRGVQRLLSLRSRVTRRSSSLIEYEVGLPICDFGGELAVELVSREPGVTPGLKAMEGKLARYALPTDDLAHALENEFLLLDHGMNAGLGNSWTLGVYKPNRTRRELAELFRALIRGARGGYPAFHAMIDTLAPQKAPQWWERVRMVATGNIAGEWALRPMAATYEYPVRQRLKTLARLRLARVVIALRSYELRSGKLPESIDELEPGELDRVPVDPFDGQPLRYSREKKRVYSVGPDLHDDGGRDEHSNNDDPTFQLRF